MSDINLLVPTITLAVGVVLGYSFRGLIAREERAELVRLQGYYDDLANRIRSIASRSMQDVKQVVTKVGEAL